MSVTLYLFFDLLPQCRVYVIVDDNDTPIEIDNVQEFFDPKTNMQQQYPFLSEYKTYTKEA